MPRFLLALVVTLCVPPAALIVAADEQNPPIPTAVKAPEEALAASTKKASDLKDHATQTATKNYSTDLNAALASAMHSGNLDEANRIKTEIDRTTRGETAPGSDAPKSPSAVAARRRFDQVLNKANEQFGTSVEAATRKCCGDLELATRQCLKAGDLDGANRIKAEIERIKSTAPTATASVHSGKEELLELVNTEKDVVGGTVVKNEAGFTVSNSGHLMIPYSPKGDYAVQIRAMRTGGSNDILVYFPVGDTVVTLVLSGWGGSASGLEMVNQMAYDKNKTTISPGKLANDKWYDISITVMGKGDRAAVLVQLNHADYIHWSGKEADLSAVADVPERVKQEKLLMLGSAHDAVDVYASVKVVERSR